VAKLKSDRSLKAVYVAGLDELMKKIEKVAKYAVPNIFVSMEELDILAKIVKAPVFVSMESEKTFAHYAGA
jgi:hypothetical protein